ncbi:MAG: hypothetical protein JWL92_407 [Candidatus Nomurabacteria bacterium]|nr:hypothetical protein [Candidatus Nomurabacteria bacterium]
MGVAAHALETLLKRTVLGRHGTIDLIRNTKGIESIKQYRPHENIHLLVKKRGEDLILPRSVMQVSKEVRLSTLLYNGPVIYVPKQHTAIVPYSISRDRLKFYRTPPC